MIAALLFAASAHASWVAPPNLRLPAAASRCTAPRSQAFDGDDDDILEAEVDLVEPETGKVLPCFMAASLEYEGEMFAALYPVNAPVSLATMLNDDRLVPLEEEVETPNMLAAASAACAAADIELLPTPVVLTATGPGLELVDGDAEALEYADDGEETEEALVLAEFEHEGIDVLVVQTLDPLYVVGKKVDDKTFAVPTDNEIDAVSDTIEQLVVEFEEGFDDDDDFENGFDA